MGQCRHQERECLDRERSPSFPPSATSPHPPFSLSPRQLSQRRRRERERFHRAQFPSSPPSPSTAAVLSTPPPVPATTPLLVIFPPVPPSPSPRCWDHETLDRDHDLLSRPSPSTHPLLFTSPPPSS